MLVRLPNDPLNTFRSISIKAANTTQIRELNKPLARLAENGGRYLVASIDLVGVQVGAGLVAHGDERPAKCKRTRGKKFLLVK